MHLLVTVLILGSLQGVFSAEGDTNSTVTEVPSSDAEEFSSSRTTAGYFPHIEYVPFVVSIRQQKYGKFQHICSGALVTKDIVLTTAHCVHNVPKPSLKVYAGDCVDSASLISTEVTVVRLHKRFKMYQDGSYANNIAVLELLTPYEVTKRISPIKLAKKRPRIGERFEVTGWINMKYGRRYTDRVRLLALPAYDTKKCAMMYQNVTGYPFHSGLICGGSEYDNKGTCEGDDGAPVVYKQKLIGLALAENNSRIFQELPHLFIDIQYFYGWIKGDSIRPCLSSTLVIIISIALYCLNM